MINDRLRELRKTILELTMEKFGEHIGVKKNTVSQWESGKNEIPEYMIKFICREFGVNYFWLTEGTGEPLIGIPETLIDEVVAEYDLDEDDKSIILNYLKLSKENREILKNFLRNVLKKEPD